MSPCYKRSLSKSSRWYFRIRHQGFNFTSKAIYLTRKEAQQAEREKTRELEEEARRPKSAMMLKDLMEKRLDYIQEQKSKKYYKDNRRYFKTALDVWGNIPASTVTKEMVYELQMEEGRRMKREGKTNTAPNAMIRSLKALFHWGEKVYDVGIKNPCNLDLLKTEKNTKYIPADSEIEAVRKLLDDHQALLFDFVSQTACRVNEALNFQSGDVIGDKIVLYTRKARNSTRTPRIIPKPQCLEGIEWEGELFGQWTDHPRFLEKAVKKLNLKWNWHNLRHRTASQWANNGMTIVEIQHRLGHSNSSTTDIYLQLLGFVGDKLATQSSPNGRK